jgi:A/G-specific adenine glycosylase
MTILHPLGLAHRSLRLPALGRSLVNDHQGQVPSSFSALAALPGVGRYTANAVLTVAYRQRRPLLDPNVIRLIERVFDRRSDRSRARDDSELWAFVESLLPERGAREFNLALVDLGATVCRPRRPRCSECPLAERCLAAGRQTAQTAARRVRRIDRPPRRD